VEWVALLLAIVAVCLFIVQALLSRPRHLGWFGLACITVSLIIWNAVAGLEPIVNRP
jgi:hypothetical protein